jgi:hypothetical protein
MECFLFIIFKYFPYAGVTPSLSEVAAELGPRLRSVVVRVVVNLLVILPSRNPGL